jgi:hypothetical protein
LLPLASWSDSALDSRLPLAILFPFAAVVSTTKLRMSGLVAVALFCQLPAYALVMRAGVRRQHSRTAAAAILLLHLAGIGLGGPLSWGPSLPAYGHKLAEAAGPKARECGIVALPQDRGGATNCARAALAEGRSFSVAFQVLGIDSTIYVGLAYRARGEAMRMVWDSDVSGGYNLVPIRHIHQESCPVPAIRDAEKTSPISCGERPDPGLSE